MEPEDVFPETESDVALRPRAKYMLWPLATAWMFPVAVTPSVLLKSITKPSGPQNDPFPVLLVNVMSENP